MTIIQAIQDRELGFRRFLDREGSLRTWREWMAALRALYGLQIAPERRELVRQCTGRSIAKLPRDGFNEALLLCGRRSGKSKITAVIGAFEALFGGHESRLSPGERGLIAILAPTKQQGTVIHGYLRAIFASPVLAGQVVSERIGRFELKNGLTVMTLQADHRTLRAFTICVAICDEIAFLYTNETAKVKSDTELIRGLRPAMLTTGGKLIALTTPYSTSGWCYKTHKSDFGNDKGSVLVWNATSQMMNANLRRGRSAARIARAYADDPSAAASEYGARFREDLSELVPRAVVEALVVKGRRELLPDPNTVYQCFVDVSGGRRDEFALAIAHKDQAKHKTVVDLVRRWRPPLNPARAIREMCTIAARYSCQSVHGDHYAAEFSAAAFKAERVGYVAARPKSELYLAALGALCSGTVELPDQPRLIDQIAGLVRSTGSGGRDKVDHQPNARDDMANAVCGAIVLCSKLREGRKLGAAYWHRPNARRTVA